MVLLDLLLIRWGRDKARLAAIKRAMESRNRAAVPSLIHILRTAGSDVQQIAAEALGKIGDRRAVEALIEVVTMKRRADYLKGEAMRALAALGDARAIPALEEMLSIDADYTRYVQGGAVATLGALGDGETTGPKLLRLLRHGEERVRKSAAYTVGDTAPAGAVQALIEALNDKNEDVRRAAVSGLTTLRDASAIKPLLRFLEREYPRSRREEVVKSLEKISPEWKRSAEVEHAAQRWIQSLGSTDVGERSVSAELLGIAGRDEAIEPLKRLLHDSSADVRSTASAALSKLGWTPGPGAERYGWHLDREEYDALVALGEAAVRFCGSVALEGDRARREAAIEVLRRSEDPLSSAVLRGLLAPQVDDAIRIDAWAALAKDGKHGMDVNAMAVDLLRDRKLKSLAARRLTQSGDAQYLDALMDYVVDAYDPPVVTAIGSTLRVARLRGDHGPVAQRMEQCIRTLANGGNEEAIATLELIARGM